MHDDTYGYKMPFETAELVNLRLTAIGRLSKPVIKAEKYSGEDPAKALKGTREVYMDGTRKMVPIYERKLLKCGNQIEAPAIVEQVDSTTVIFEGHLASVDEYLNIIIEPRKD